MRGIDFPKPRPPAAEQDVVLPTKGEAVNWKEQYAGDTSHLRTIANLAVANSAI